jgi:hypothetical protein
MTPGVWGECDAVDSPAPPSAARARIRGAREAPNPRPFAVADWLRRHHEVRESPPFIAQWVRRRAPIDTPSEREHRNRVGNRRARHPSHRRSPLAFVSGGAHREQAFFGSLAVSWGDPWLCGPASRPGCHFSGRRRASGFAKTHEIRPLRRRRLRHCPCQVVSGHAMLSVAIAYDVHRRFRCCLVSYEKDASV